MRKLLAALAILVVSQPVIAQDEFIPDEGQSAGAGQGEDDPQKEREKQLKKWEEAIKDAKKIEGVFTFYQKEDDVYWELDPSQLGKYWFFQVTLRTGAGPGLQAGDPVSKDFLSADAYRWERNKEEVWLYYPNLAWRWSQDDPMATSASRSYPEAILDSFKIEAEHPDSKKLLVNVTTLFHGELYDLQQLATQTLGRPYQLDRDKSRVSEILGFPENVVVRADLHFMSPPGAGGGMMSELLEMLGLGGKSHLADPRSLPLSVTYSLYPDKESDYMPRYSDPRVGYFTQDYYDHGKFMNFERTSRLITRWNVKKKDPTAELSEPEKPIVWYIDDSVPPKWRDACAEGILRWNKAFERLGIKNAIEVRMKPADADWDHADMRHNVLRFTASENAGYAVALFRTNPFTGEIINAAITCDANMVWVAGPLEWELIVKPSKESWTSSSSRLLRGAGDDTPEAKLAKALKERYTSFTCDYPQQAMRQAAFAWTALETLIPDRTSINMDEYINEFLADVVSHEMGHCLGLRHNFIASTAITLEELRDDKTTEAFGTSASVMDYNPANIAAVAQGRGHYWNRTIGPYDVFAIEYGYKDVTGDNPIEEYSNLMQIASRASLPGHRYMTDENADSFDPYVVRFDISKDPIEGSALTMRVAKNLLAKADQRYPKKGRPYSDLTRVVNLSLNMTVREALTMARFVGGVSGSRNFKGDPNERNTLAPVDSSMQRKAIQYLAKELLSETSFKLSDKVLLNLSGDANSPMYSPAPIKDALSSMQQMVVSMLMSANTTDLVANNAYKTASDPKRFTLAELYSTIVGKVFSEVGTGRQIGPLRRDLQRFVVEALITQALAQPGQVQEDVRAIAMDTLRRLRGRFGTASSTDDMTAVHLRDTTRRIQKALDSVMIGR